MTLESAIAARMNGRPYRYYAQVGSTMDEARQWIADGAPHGAVVIASQQTAGRGRMGRAWLNTDTVSLAVSIILKVPESALSQATMLCALMVLDTVSDLGVRDATLKWPNDVLIEGRKVSGILIETVWDENPLRGVILGMGINISGSFNNPDVAQTAISLEQALGAAPPPAAVFSRLIDAYDRRIRDFNTPQLFHAWRARLGTIGQRVRIESAHPFEGVAEDVADNGALFVRSDDGQLRTVLAADVRLRPA